MSNAIEVNESNFEQEVLNASTPVLVDEIAGEYIDKVKVVKVNTDDNAEVAKQYQISGLPSILVFKDGEAVERMVGLMPKSTIIGNIEKHL